jgi:hypothetical protein
MVPFMEPNELSELDLRRWRGRTGGHFPAAAADVCRIR